MPKDATLEAEVDAEEGLGTLRSASYHVWSSWRVAAAVLLSLLTGGLFLLLPAMSDRVRCRFTRRPCAPDEADSVLCTCQGHSSRETMYVLVPLVRAEGGGPASGALLCFDLIYRRYYVSVEDAAGGTVPSPLAFRSALPGSQLVRAEPPDDETVGFRQTLFGSNEMDVPIDALGVLGREVLRPFYAFQLFSIVVWFNNAYEAYATCILVLSICSVAINVTETVQNRRAIREKAALDAPVLCLRGGRAVRLSSTRLVPGDVVGLADGMPVPCDAVLVSGGAVVNESALTGESVPVQKLAVRDSPQVFSLQRDSHCALYAGTTVVATHPDGAHQLDPRLKGAGASAAAVVVRTRFATSKGRLVRFILLPARIDFEMHRDALRFLTAMLAMALIGFTYSAVYLARLGYGSREIALKSLDLITIAVPPVLPIVLTAGTSFAVRRLRGASVFCTDTAKVNVAGSVVAVLFDKTGTLTEDQMRVVGHLAVSSPGLPVPETGGGGGPAGGRRRPAAGPVLLQLERNVAASRSPALRTVFAACHSVSRAGSDLVGDPLDLQLFRASGVAEPRAVLPPDWPGQLPVPQSSCERFTEDPEPVAPAPSPESSWLDEFCRPSRPGGALRLAVLHEHSFSSDLQRMSVVALNVDSGHLAVLTKGSPEAVADLCDPASLPPDMAERLAEQTQHGRRVLACAVRPLGPAAAGVHPAAAPGAERGLAECSLLFAGFLVLENLLKPETVPTLRQLREARLRSVMVTGDNVVTAVAVGRQCGLLHPHAQVLIVDRSHRHHGSHLPDDLGAVMDELRFSRLVPPRDPHPPVGARARPQRRSRPSHDAEDDSGPTDGAGAGGRDRSRSHEAADDPLQGGDLEIGLPAERSDDVGGADEVVVAMSSAPPVTISASPSSGTLNFERGPEGAEVPSLAAALRHASSQVGPRHRRGEQHSGPPEQQQQHQQGEEKSVDGLLAEPWDVAERWDDLDEMEVAVTGRAFEVLDSLRRRDPSVASVVSALVSRAGVFARMSPDGKANVVRAMRASRRAGRGGSPGSATPALRVAMVGDGANDCAALRAADVGLSLADTEASIAAPFTSKVPNIAPVVDLLRECRAAVSTSFGLFKFMVLYPLIQAVHAIILYARGARPGDLQYLYVDLAVVLPLAVLMSRSRAAARLGTTPPTVSLVDPRVGWSLGGPIVYVVLFQAIVVNWVEAQPWYRPIVIDQEAGLDTMTYDGTFLFALANFQYVACSLGFMVDASYRAPVWTNVPYSVVALASWLTSTLVLLAPTGAVRSGLELVLDGVPFKFQFENYLLAVAFLVLVLLHEAFFYEQIVARAGRFFRRAAR